MEAAVCRVLLSVLLYTSGVSLYPQDVSAITYVRPALEPQASAGARDSRVERLPLVIGGLSEESDEASDSQEVSTPRTREDTTTSSYETSTAPGASEEAEPTEANEVKPRFPSPRYTSKLSYFHKSNIFEGSALANHLERTGKRKFRSRCRCEKIWNCPKLQITVPRCPDEYFMCCF